MGLVCLDLVTVVDHFPKEDTDMRSSAQYKVSQSGMSATDIFLKVRGGNANNSCRVLAELGFPATFLGSLAGQVAPDQPINRTREVVNKLRDCHNVVMIELPIQAAISQEEEPFSFHMLICQCVNFSG